MDITGDIQKLIKGDVDASDATKEFYSHDASLFELVPQVVTFPKDAEDIKAIVRYIIDNRKDNPSLNVVARSRGTDMSGAAIGESIIMDTSKYMTRVWDVSSVSARTEPGAMYKDFEVETLKQGAYMPSYPASRDMAGMGGIVNNNSGGEKSLRFGKTAQYVSEIKMVLADGNEYTIKPIKKDELVRKMSQGDFEGNLYKQTFELLEKHYDKIQAAKPKVSKDSTGYHLWDVWNRDTGIFDLTKLFVGAQGTLGLMTEAKLSLVPEQKHTGLLVLFLRDIDTLGELIPKVLKYNPVTFESFDDQTLWLSIKFLPSFWKMLGTKRFIQLLFNLIPDGLQLLRGIPKLILMVEFNGDSEAEVRSQIKALHNELGHERARYEINGFEETPTAGKSEKFWVMRRNSFQILRSKVKDKHTAPFIDDFIVPPANLPKFFPELREIIKKYKLFATIAGHMGDGNFHVIPLMKIEDPKEREKLVPCQKEVNELVLKYEGSISGEHNDGLVRGPWLEQMYGKEVFDVMKEVKQLYDPDNIFNPHKKTDATYGFSFTHIREHF
ncbi:MAG TPA: FAD-binding oxidoreductase [Patescibacteria group bacterium]|jgi:FAD/FMN-containing dehydrogenase|nr:FAD-binding oxidoreductase [Patescibacteria group bacterium]